MEGRSGERERTGEELNEEDERQREGRRNRVLGGGGREGRDGRTE